MEAALAHQETGRNMGAEEEERRERILIVDDDEDIRALVSTSLARHGYQVVTAANVIDAEHEIARWPIDLIILDVMMPGEDGLSFCRRISGRDGPLILILSALDSSGDRIVGLELGADSYLPKPCDPRELVANVRAMLRRSRLAISNGPDLGRSAEFDDWQLDLVARFLRDRNGTIIDLSSSEFALLRAFVEHPKRVLSRDQLINLAYPADADVFDRAVDVQISRLRRKFGVDGNRLIQTVRYEGYMFATPVIRR